MHDEPQDEKMNRRPHDRTLWWSRDVNAIGHDGVTAAGVRWRAQGACVGPWGSVAGPGGQRPGAEVTHPSMWRCRPRAVHRKIEPFSDAQK